MSEIRLFMYWVAFVRVEETKSVTALASETSEVNLSLKSSRFSSIDARVSLIFVSVDVLLSSTDAIVSLIAFSIELLLLSNIVSAWDRIVFAKSRDASMASIILATSSSDIAPESIIDPFTFNWPSTILILFSPK